MNLRQPYEQLIASKLRQLRAPDADASWQQMKRLLDEDEDTGGGGRKRPPGNNGLWRLGILAIVLSASFWLYVDKTPSPGTSLSKNNTGASPQADSKTTGAAGKINSNKTQTATIDNKTTLTVSEKNNTTTENNTASGSTVTGKSAAITPVKENINAAVKNNAGTAVNEPSGATAQHALNPGESSSKNNSTKNIPVKTDRQNDFSPGLASTEKNKGNKYKQYSKDNTVVTGDAIADAGLANNTAADNHRTEVLAHNQSAHKTKTGTGKKGNNIFSNDDEIALTAGNNTLANNNFQVNQLASSKEKTWFERLTELKTADPLLSFNTALVQKDSITGMDANNLLNNETKKGIAKAKRENEIAIQDKKDKKSLHLNLSNLFKPFSMHIDAEPWWAAGIALNAPITVNAQNRFNYNMNAKSNTLSDYIPSPYLQFHLNNYVYLQTELNFVSPQYTPQLLVYRQSNDISTQMAGTSQEKSIYIQKMYYFNWPVSLHYSPISNLFFSGGIQFSSFQSGLATIEEKQYPTLLGTDHSNNINSTTLKFKDDSIAAKIAPNEWRWQVGAEYYMNRFSVGLRYNQSFKNAINTTVLPGMAPTVNRNQSLLFFVRYNLFESRQKNSVPKNQ